MSCDYAVWHTQYRLSNQQAGRVYKALCAGDTSAVQDSPAVDALYRELTALHPEIDQVPEDQIDNHDLCPWSVAMDRSPGHLIVNCVWPKADDVGQLLRKLAGKHGLALYDPQSEQVSYPDDASPSVLVRLWRNLRESGDDSPRDPWYVDVGIGALFLLVAWFAYGDLAELQQGHGHSALLWLYRLGGKDMAVGAPALLSAGFMLWGLRKWRRSR